MANPVVTYVTPLDVQSDDDECSVDDVAAEMDTWRAVVKERSKTWRTMNDVWVEMAKNCPNLFQSKRNKSAEEFLAEVDATCRKCATCGRCEKCERCGWVEDPYEGPGPALRHWIDRSAGLLPPSPKFKLRPLSKEERAKIDARWQHEAKILADLRAAGMPEEVHIDVSDDEVELVCDSSQEKKVTEFLDKIGNVIDGKPARVSIVRRA